MKEYANLFVPIKALVSYEFTDESVCQFNRAILMSPITIKSQVPKLLFCICYWILDMLFIRSCKSSMAHWYVRGEVALKRQHSKKEFSFVCVSAIR